MPPDPSAVSLMSFVSPSTRNRTPVLFDEDLFSIVGSVVTPRALSAPSEASVLQPQDLIGSGPSTALPSFQAVFHSVHTSAPTTAAVQQPLLYCDFLTPASMSAGPQDGLSHVKQFAAESSTHPLWYSELDGQQRCLSENAVRLISDHSPKRPCWMPAPGQSIDPDITDHPASLPRESAPQKLASQLWMDSSVPHNPCKLLTVPSSPSYSYQRRSSPRTFQTPDLTSGLPSGSSSPPTATVLAAVDSSPYPTGESAEPMLKSSFGERIQINSNSNASCMSTIQCGHAAIDKKDKLDSDTKETLEENLYFSEYFQSELPVYTAVSDPHARVLYRARDVASQLGAQVSNLCMFLKRLPNKLEHGVFQASAVEDKPKSHAGLKRGAYFISEATVTLFVAKLERTKDLQPRKRSRKRRGKTTVKGLPHKKAKKKA